FAGRHHLLESILDPLFTVVPLCAYLWFVKAAPFSLILQVTIAGFIGISAILLLTFFAAEKWMAVVTRHLIDHGIPIPFEALPTGGILVGLNGCLGLTVAVTALMIGGLANQRARDMLRHSDMLREEVVDNLQLHTILISVAAVTTGFVLSRFLANSVAS